MFSQIVEWGWFGFGRADAGAQGNLFPAICLGIVRFGWCRGHLGDAIKGALK